MTWTRWKLLAGVLGVSVGGLAATCQEPSAKKCHTPVAPVAAVVPALPVIPAAAAVQTTLPPPLAVAAPTPAEAPKVTLVPLTPSPVALDLPKLDASPLPVAVAAEPLKLDVAPPPKPAESPKLDLPSLDVAPPPVKVESPKLDLPKIEPKPAPVQLPTLDLAPPRPADPVKIEPVRQDPLLTLKPSDLPPDVAPLPSKVPTRPVSRSAQPSLATGVRVLVRIGEGRPNFDVMMGDDCLLKAVSDRMEVKAPGDRSPMTPLTAAGGVRFTAPGCEGTCDTLTVLPATGEVELTGTVRVRCKRGKGETEFSGGTMRFKLGTAPAYTVGQPTLIQSGASEIPPTDG